MKTALAVFSLLLAGVLQAQEPKTVTGVVYGVDSAALPGTTVHVYEATGRQPLASAVADGKGYFQFRLPSSAAYLLAEHVGYAPYKRTAPFTDTVVIRMQAIAKELEEVLLLARKPLIEHQFDRTVLHINRDPSLGTTAADIVGRIPGARIVNNSDILIENQNVTVFIDGKPSRMSGADLMNLLRTMPAKNINQVEVIYTPSAREDASMSGAIINISTYRLMKPGYDATLSVMAGHGWKYFMDNSVSGSLNYRKGADYIYVSSSASAGKQSQQIDEVRYLHGDGLQLNGRSISANPYSSVSLRAGWDHYLRNKSIAGLLVTAYDNSYHSHNHTTTGIGRLGGTYYDSVQVSDAFNPTDRQGVNINANFKWLGDSARRQAMTTDLDAGFFQYANNARLDLHLENGAGSPLHQPSWQEQRSGNHSHIYSYKSDYSQAWKKTSLEAGVKASYADISNRFDVDGIAAGAPLPGKGRNDFRYRETLLAGYVGSRYSLSKWTFRMGLRGEQTFTNGYSAQLDNRVKRSYFNLFPDATVGYKKNKQLLSLSYSRRISRPSYRFLNPFILVYSAYTQSQGNPYLNPSFSNNFRLSWTVNNKLSVTLWHSRVRDAIAEMDSVNEATKISTTRRMNMERNVNSGLFVNYNVTLFKIWTIGYTVGGAINSYRFDYSNRSNTVRQPTAYTYLNNRVRLPKDWWVSAYCYAQTKVVYGARVNLPMTYLDISGGKRLWKGKGDLSIDLNDIFFTSVQRSRSQYGNVDLYSNSRYDSRRFRISLSYNWGNEKVEVRRRSSGSSDEQGRNN